MPTVSTVRSLVRNRGEKQKQKQKRNALGNVTDNDQVVSFHDQAGGQKHGPEDGLLVFFQRLEDGQQAVCPVALLRLADEVDGVCMAQLNALELMLGRHHCVCCHNDGNVGRVRAWQRGDSGVL